MTAYLSASPVRVLHARDGVEALSLARTAVPRRVVLDIRLPRMDGWEVLARMKADPATRAIPVVVASIIDERPRGLQLGAVAYLLKPVRRDDLLDALRGRGSTGSTRCRRCAVSPRILVIEDNALNLKLVRDVLEHAGYDVGSAATGELGVAAAATEPPDLVLLDLQLPGIDGHETLRRLREEVLPDGVPVVAVTALAMAEDRERAQRAGFDGYLEKPISPRALPAQVERFLAGGAA